MKTGLEGFEPTVGSRLMTAESDWNAYGPRYGSREFIKTMQTLGLKRKFVWKNTPEQNGYVESFHGMLKREYVWPHEFVHFQMPK